MTQNSPNEPPTLVLGGPGKTGRRVGQRLGARGLPVRVGFRSGQPPFDWDEQSTCTRGVSQSNWDSPRGLGCHLLRRHSRAVRHPDLIVPRATKAVRAFAELAIEQGIPVEIVDFLTDLFNDVLGTNADVTDGVQRSMGRPPRGFTDYATRTAATGIWTQAVDR